jgi:hypothetical protein
MAAHSTRTGEKRKKKKKKRKKEKKKKENHLPEGVFLAFLCNLPGLKPSRTLVPGQ